jgi:hypothetical protein
MFIAALAGIGYVPPADPDGGLRTPSNAAASFQLGQPVYEGFDDLNGRQIMAARRKMEEVWAKNKRPKDVSCTQAGMARIKAHKLNVRVPGCATSMTMEL